MTTAKRWHTLPNLPTVADTLPGYEVVLWFGTMAPRGTPQPIIDRLNKEFTAVLNMPDIKDILFKQGLDAAPGTPDAFGAYIKSETAKWAKVIKASGAKPE